eukprot:6034305-Amphidinium_carterae.1
MGLVQGDLTVSSCTDVQEGFRGTVHHCLCSDVDELDASDEEDAERFSIQKEYGVPWATLSSNSGALADCVAMWDAEALAMACTGGHSATLSCRAPRGWKMPRRMRCREQPGECHAQGESAGPPEEVAGHQAVYIVGCESACAARKVGEILWLQELER